MLVLLLLQMLAIHCVACQTPRFALAPGVTITVMLTSGPTMVNSEYS